MADAVVFFAFRGHELLARGPLPEVARALRNAADGMCKERLAMYLDDTGAPTEVDVSGSEKEMLGRLRERFPSAFSSAPSSSQQRARGRPKLGIVSREVSLLPRHWQWLSEQRGGASATLRRLIDAERKREGRQSFVRTRIDAAHRFMWDIAGNEPGFEEASRALYAHDFERFEQLVLSFPVDVQSILLRYVVEAKAAARSADAPVPDED